MATKRDSSQFQWEQKRYNKRLHIICTKVHLPLWGTAGREHDASRPALALRGPAASCLKCVRERCEHVFDLLRVRNTYLRTGACAA